MNTVLFVDDEPRVLAGLRRMLWTQRRVWSMEFVDSSHEALRLLDAQVFDAVVSDFRMPDMNGGQLLQAVRERHPDTARLVLSGHTDEDDLLKVVIVAHQFLNKPCAPEDLIAAIGRALRLREELNGEEVRAEVTGIDVLPTPPSVLRAMVSALDAPDADARKVAAVIESDIALTTKLLQLVNSAFFMDGKRVESVHEAVVRVGLNAVRSIVLAREIMDSIATDTVTGPWLEALSSAAVAKADLARRLARPEDVSDAFAAAMVSECGQLAYASCRPEVFEHHLRERARTGLALADVEPTTFGITHPRTGAYLLSLWGFPFAVVEAVGRHADTPDADARVPFACQDAVQLAHAVVEHKLESMCGPLNALGITDDVLKERGALSIVEEWWADLSRTNPALVA